MKRIFLVSMCFIASAVIFSCTNDTVETTPNNNTTRVVADDTSGGQTGQIPITPPKPQ
jgi:hypothetical protein